MPSGDRFEIGSSEAFIAELGLMLEEAYQSDIDVEGGWTIHASSTNIPDWDVEIWQVKKES